MIDEKEMVNVNPETKRVEETPPLAPPPEASLEDLPLFMRRLILSRYAVALAAERGAQ